MPDEEKAPSQETTLIEERESLRNFREFLKTKADEFGIRDRHRRRGEWLAAINRLFDQIRDWLHQSDPEGLLDIEPFEVARTEHDLGSYDAPALKIQLGAGEVSVLPMEHEVPIMAIRGASGTSTQFAGRVDITDGFRKYNLYRKVRDGKDVWQIRDDRNRFTYLDADSFVRILQELLS
jgi:hypothetical protein